MEHLRFVRGWLAGLIMLNAQELGSQPRASLQVWYSIRNQVPVYAAPTLSSRRIGQLSRATPVCILSFREQFAAVRLIDGLGGGSVEGFVEKFAIARQQVPDRRAVSVANACFSPPVVAKAPASAAPAPPVSDASALPAAAESPRAPVRASSDSADRAAALAEFRRLALAQESFWAEKLTYAPSMADLHRFFVPNAALTTELLEATEEGWDARVTVIKTGLACVFRSRVSEPEAAPPSCSVGSAGG